MRETLRPEIRGWRQGAGQRPAFPSQRLDKKGTKGQSFPSRIGCHVNQGLGEARRKKGQMHISEMTLKGYRLTTAEILYHMPDHPAVLQTYIWQEFDLAPKFPILNRFLDFWRENLDGKLHSVRLAARGLISAAEIRHVGKEITLH